MPQHVGTPNIYQEVTGVIWGLEGNTPRMSFMSPPSHMTEMDRITDIMSCLNQLPSNTLLKVIKPNPSEHGETG